MARKTRPQSPSSTSATPLYKQVQKVLQDKQWHCRGHEFKHVGSTQIAGGGGFQRVERGNKSSEAWQLERKKKHCVVCGGVKNHIRWTGRLKPANAPAGFPAKLKKRILEHHDFTDASELKKRPAIQLVIDHRFPMIRWGGHEAPLDPAMPAEAIEAKFQLLKKDDGGNHNSQKTRVCERCFKTGRRGTPFGIMFFYEGTENWDSSIPKSGSDAERGCEGCGWYNFDLWRKGINAKLTLTKPAKSVLRKAHKRRI